MSLYVAVSRYNEVDKNLKKNTHFLRGLKEWKVSIFKIVDQRIKFYSQNTNLLLPKPKSTFRNLKQGI